MTKEYTRDELSGMDGVERAKVAIKEFQAMVPIIDILETQIRIQQEDQIMKAVADVGVRVDKQRLMMALSDAQHFYEEGYRAARNAADVVEVVRCKDCEYYNEDCMSPHSGWCECLERAEYNEHYCNYAKRRDDDG